MTTPISDLPKELFLSHATRNRAFATRLARVLRRHHVPVCYSQTNLVGAQQWHDEIGRALQRCDWFLVVLSPSSVNSEWVKRELLFALQEPKFRGRIVPILHRSCETADLSWTLPSFQYVDFRKSFETGCAELLRVWGLGYSEE